MAGRQWTQTRVFKAGWSEHNRCIACLNAIVDADTPPDNQCMRTVRDQVVATAEQIARAPVGNCCHRLWKGDCNSTLRKELAPANDVQDLRGCSVEGHAAWEKALMPRPTPPKRGVSPCETFHWHVRPQSLPVTGTKYTDGSVREGAYAELARCG